MHQKDSLFLSDPHHICRAYSEGRIGWRFAVRALRFDSYEELITEMRNHSFSIPMPKEDDSRALMDRLEQLLYHEDER
ncbi:MAG: hypothetical protein EAY65_05130 [Alphaproteobacteria bacterium]|nr:MAG: hypothetical protein EAY65_05130 [Alphaproteobacteria bacterium]